VLDLRRVPLSALRALGSGGGGSGGGWRRWRRGGAVAARRPGVRTSSDGWTSTALAGDARGAAARLPPSAPAAPASQSAGAAGAAAATPPPLRRRCRSAAPRPPAAPPRVGGEHSPRLREFMSPFQLTACSSCCDAGPRARLRRDGLRQDDDGDRRRRALPLHVALARHLPVHVAPELARGAPGAPAVSVLRWRCARGAVAWLARSVWGQLTCRRVVKRVAPHQPADCCGTPVSRASHFPLAPSAHPFCSGRASPRRTSLSSTRARTSCHAARAAAGAAAAPHAVCTRASSSFRTTSSGFVDSGAAARAGEAFVWWARAATASHRCACPRRSRSPLAPLLPAPSLAVPLHHLRREPLAQDGGCEAHARVPAAVSGGDAYAAAKRHASAESPKVRARHPLEVGVCAGCGGLRFQWLCAA